MTDNYKTNMAALREACDKYQAAPGTLSVYELLGYLRSAIARHDEACADVTELLRWSADHREPAVGVAGDEAEEAAVEDDTYDVDLPEGHTSSWQADGCGDFYDDRGKSYGGVHSATHVVDSHVDLSPVEVAE